MVNFKLSLVHSLDRCMRIFLTKLQIVFGYNSSDIRPRHLQNILTLANLNGKELCVLDGGANIGDFTDVVLSQSFDSRILCVEPQESLVKLLRNKYIGRNVECLAIGLGTSDGKANLFYSSDGDRKASLGNQRENLNSREISILTLSKVFELSKIESFDILKLDLEGMDVPVLAEFFRQHTTELPKVIILEVSYLANYYGFTSRKSFQLLSANGYHKIFRTSPFLGLIPVNLSDVRDYEGHTVNWIALKS